MSRVDHEVDATEARGVWTRIEPANMQGGRTLTLDRNIRGKVQSVNVCFAILIFFFFFFLRLLKELVVS